MMLCPGCLTSALLLLLLACAACVGSDSGSTAGNKRAPGSLTRSDLAHLPRDNRTMRMPPPPRPRYPQLGCKTLRSKMLISDGFCTSLKPVSSILCTGNCLPEGDLPWYAQYMKYWSRTKIIEYSCEDDVIKRKRVELVCENGETKTIRIKVVRSCKCVRNVVEQNRPIPDSFNKHHRVSNDGTGKSRKYRRRKNKRKNKKRRKGHKRNNRKTSNKEELSSTRTPVEL